MPARASTSWIGGAWTGTSFGTPFRDISSEADRASRIIDGIGQLARRSRPQHQPLRVATIVGGVVALVVRECRSREVAIQTDVPADLPVLLGDRVQLQQVLLNLVVNALDAMSDTVPPQRLVAIRARSDRHAGGPAVRISVVDRGGGLREGNAERLFQAFYTTKPQGMGLGLAISSSIVESHGGRLWAEPNKGPGATFSFLLPTALAVPADTNTDAAGRASDDVMERLRRQ